MQLTTGSHWFGVVLMFVAALLLVVASITAPVIDDLSLFNLVVGKGQEDEITFRFGTFGFCKFGGDNAGCIPIQVGYAPCLGVYLGTNEPFDYELCSTADSLTRAMVMHPVASAVAFIAAFVSFAAGFAGSLTGGIIGSLAWVFTMVAMAIDFTIWSIVKKRIDDFDQSAVIEGDFGPIIWCVVAAFVFLTVGTPVVLFTCFRVHRAQKRSAPAQTYTNSSVMSTVDDKDNVYRA